ncbi:MAG: hypothetical protein ACKPKO_18640, partial [Candidatus Fonsibacter sp.]
MRKHDGSEFGQNDLWRAKQAGKMFTNTGVLLQCRGDWAFYKQIFNFPGWNEASICWRCGCSAAERDYSDDALRRTHRVSGNQFLFMQIQKGLL